jgi:hypothetical protein
VLLLTIVIKKTCRLSAWLEQLSRQQGAAAAVGATSEAFAAAHAAAEACAIQLIYSMNWSKFTRREPAECSCK